VHGGAHLSCATVRKRGGPRQDRPVGRERALTAAAGLAALEATVLLVALSFRGGRAAPLAGLILVAKYGFCWGVTRRGAGSFLALLLYEAAALLAAVRADVPIALRVAVATLAVGTLVLLVRSAPLFPSPTLPNR
jgi:hypothetical protein